MKCNYCGTTIPKGSKQCNGCGKKITLFSNTKTSNNIPNNYKVIENYKKINKEEKSIEEIEEILAETDVPIVKLGIQDPNASSAIVLSILGIMFMPFGIIFNIIALNQAKKIIKSEEKAKIMKLVKILLFVSISMLLFILLPIIFTF